MHFSWNIIPLLALVLVLGAQDAVSAGVCTKCAGIGRYIRGFDTVECDKCGGDGQVEESVEEQLGVDAGYQTNKFELKSAVEAEGWVVAWGEDVTERDAAQGVVAAGVSIYSANPAPFVEWCNQLVERTVNSVVADGKRQFPTAIRGQVRDLANQVIKEALQGKDARQVFRRFDTVDFKAGAIRYSGRNYIGDRTIDTTWGIKPFVAFRWRGSNENVPNGPPSADTPIPKYTASYSFSGPNTRSGGVKGKSIQNYFRMPNGNWELHTYNIWDDGQVSPTSKRTYKERHRQAGRVVLAPVDAGLVDVALQDNGLFMWRSWPGNPYPFSPPEIIKWWQFDGRGVWTSGRPK